MVTNSVVVNNSASPSSRNRLAPDRVIEVSIATVTGIVLAVTLAMFIVTPLHANLSAWADSTLRPYSVPGAVYVIYAAAIIAVLLLGIMRHNVLRYFLYLSWVLYLPPILSFSRFDLLSPVIDGGLISPGAGLPPVLVLAAGLLLVSVTLAQGAVEEHRSLRKSYLERGAGREEVDAAIRGNLKYVAIALVASALLTALVSVATTGLAYFGGSLAPSGTYWYLLLAVAGGAVIAFVLMVLLRQSRH
jgi:hypothetical protein